MLCLDYVSVFERSYLCYLLKRNVSISGGLWDELQFFGYKLLLMKLSQLCYFSLAVVYVVWCIFSDFLK